MKSKTKSSSQKSKELHPRNKHQGRYDLQLLVDHLPELAAYLEKNKYGNESINFFDPLAVKALNKALLMTHYGLDFWEIPPQYLCPPIPGRADYMHYAADLLGELNSDGIPKGEKVRCLDVGVGANCIYPIIACAEYGWSFIGSDIDKRALKAAQNNVSSNSILKSKVELRPQNNPNQILNGVIKNRERIDLVVCNPPFHSSAKEANAVANKKQSNLQKKRVKETVLNFGGQANELWCEGGEYTFIRKMIKESKDYANTCLWFTSLVSKKDNLKHFYSAIEEQGAAQYRTIEMGQGNKISRIIAWTFLSKIQMEEWAKNRWKAKDKKVFFSKE